MEIKGRVKRIFKAEKVNLSLTKSALVIETLDEKYPDVFKVEFFNDKAKLTEGVNVGDEVETSVNVRGREWQNAQGEMKYFTNLAGWQLDIIEDQGQPDAQELPLPDDPFEDEDSQNLPF